MGKAVKKAFNSTVGRVVVGVMTVGLSEAARAGISAIKGPKVAAAAPAAAKATDPLEAANDKVRRDRRLRKGRASTMLTGPRGLKAEEDAVGKKLG